MANKVYELTNLTKREVYLGVTSRPVTERLKEHCVGTTKALTEWDCGRDQIEVRTVAWRKSREDASALAHELERKLAARGYPVIQTRGV